MADFSADELKEIQSLTSSIGREMDNLAKQSDKRNKQLSTEAGILKSIVTDLNSEEDIQNAIERIGRRKNTILKTNYGVNTKLKKELIDQNHYAGIGLAIKQKELKILSKVNSITNSVGDGIANGIDSLKSEIEQIPILGKVFSKLIPDIKPQVGKMSAGFTRGFGIMFKRGRSQQKGFMASFSGGMKAGFGQVSKALGPLLANPIGLAVAAIALIAGAGLLAFYKVSKAAKDFRKETGLLNSQTGELESNLAAVTSATAGMGGSIEQASSAASTFSNQMKGTSQASEAVLTSMVAMENSFGVSADAQAKVNEQFQLMSGASAETAQNMIQTTIAAAEAAGVAPAKVMQDIAENAEAGMMFFQGSTKALAKAAIEARKMGTSIGETTKVAEGLLDFESSITKELELGAMLGTRVNFNKARALAFEGDMIGMQKAVNAEVGKLGDINKMNMYQKKALSEATGMDLKSLIKQQKIAKTLPGLKEEELAAANALLDAGMDIADISKDELKRKAIEMGNQKKMQSEFDNMGNSLKAMGTQLLMAFMPIGKLIMAVLGPVIGYITGVWGPIGRAIDGIFEAFEPISNMMKDIFGDGAGIAGIFEFIGTLVSGGIVFAINLFSNGLKVVTNIIGGIYDIFKGIFTGDFDMILDGLMSLGEGILRFFATIPMVLFDTFMDMFPTIGGYIVDFFSSIGSKIKGFFLDMIPNWVRDWFMGDGELASDASELQSGGSIDDGIVQDGKIISTHPEDTLIATKTPDSLFGESMFGKIMSATPLGMIANSVNSSTDGGISNVAGGIGDAMSGVGDMIGGLFGGDTKDADIVAKLDELLIVMSGNKDVYMDGKKLTAGVSNQSDKFAGNSNALV
jgi:hypothetical protein